MHYFCSKECWGDFYVYQYQRSKLLLYHFLKGCKFTENVFFLPVKLAFYIKGLYEPQWTWSMIYCKQNHIFITLVSDTLCVIHINLTASLNAYCLKLIYIFVITIYLLMSLFYLFIFNYYLLLYTGFQVALLSK